MYYVYIFISKFSSMSIFHAFCRLCCSFVLVRTFDGSGCFLLGVIRFFLYQSFIFRPVCPMYLSQHSHASVYIPFFVLGPPCRCFVLVIFLLYLWFSILFLFLICGIS